MLAPDRHNVVAINSKSLISNIKVWLFLNLDFVLFKFNLLIGFYSRSESYFPARCEPQCWL